ncbi:glycosyltransferase family 4 protein [Candidatus Ruminimicrobiellum ovillum]|uniref:glycosyltransferase family 4 protein n=1 Tax=Candidatus Ruminimicrobiellum ovillum TaxID=1947927 RepID=UPI00355A6F54
MNKIKVAVIITKLELGGAQKVAISVCEKIDKTKFEPFLICGCGGILDEETKNKIRVIFVKDLVREINPVKDLKSLFSIYKILKQEKPGIVHTHSSKAGIIGRFAARMCGIKNIIHTIHGFSFNDTQSFLKKNLFIFLEKIGAKISKYLIPVSVENTTKGLKNNIGKKEQYHYIRLGIDIENFKNFKDKPSLKKELNIDEKDFLVTTIGPFKPQKNLPDFIKIAKDISENHKNFKFVIVGDGTLRKSFEQLIKEYNISDKIFLLGWRRDISNILNSSDFFVMTSLWEGLPISTIEAMCCGLSPVVNDVDGQREIIKNDFNGFLVKPYDIKTTEEKILLLAHNKQLKNTLSINAKNSIDYTFSIDYMIKKHEELYSSL